ncbi:dnaJ homolog subfamily C member 2-like [Schistocerca gregaria]|uniref:dnaJ homolog subfamily C member 2-like n=1 Tax=Schistocerca gregaria TaxID=7010 RepID=UPI00211EA039|nr:dnaJ homolog subfamily C member 2-like [Schistocerca gregaria]
MEDTSFVSTDISADVRQITITALSRRSVQCVGPWFLAHIQGKLIDAKSALTGAAAEERDDEDDSPNAKLFDPDDVTLLRTLDPKEWKLQDHYAVLGLSKLRYKATEEDIKKAYRMKVLLHHPDKRKAAGEDVRPDDDYFTCITKAYEILGNPQKRRSFDSVDPAFTDPAPPSNDHTKKHFFKVFAEAFALEARFSEKLPVPPIGGPDDPRESVEKFYDFWYNFESWREFSYLDEEDKEKGQIREERKWIEKQNKFYRAKRKKEDMTRIRNLVDSAYALDPRIAKFKQEDKDRKEAAKQAKREAARARQAEEERKLQEAQEIELRKKAEIEAVEKARLSALKAEREAQKKTLKVKRATLRKLVKSNNYYIENEEERVRHMASLEKLCEVLKPEQIDELLEKMRLGGRSVYISAIEDTEKQIEEERQALLTASQRNSGASGAQGSRKGGQVNWSTEEIHVLIKAVNLFPAGTNQRWEVIANFINQHDVASSNKKTAKDVLAKAKSLQSSDFSRNVLKETVNKQAYNIFEKEHSAGDTSGSMTERLEEETPWTGAEQKLLEQALKTYPNSTPNRWERIAECIPTRTKKQCISRYKEIAEMVKAKKAAQAAAEQKKK